MKSLNHKELLEYLIKHTFFVFIFFAIPLSGWFLHKKVPKKTITYSAYVLLILLLPALTGYDYIIDNMYGILLYLLLICGYALFLISSGYKLTGTIIFSVLLFFICAVASFVGGFVGSITVDKQWTVHSYKITYVRDQGFAGGPRMTYELRKYALVPIFIKRIDTAGDTDSCWVKFTEGGFNFNKCTIDSSYIIK